MIPVSLPVLTPTPTRPLRITLTDISQFVRVEQCERFLRFRLSERAGRAAGGPCGGRPDAALRQAPRICYNRGIPFHGATL